MSKTRFIETLSQWHLQHRLKEYEKYGARASGIKFRNKIHSFLLTFVKLDRVLSKREMHIVNDKHYQCEKPIIFAVAHVGGFDFIFCIAKDFIPFVPKGQYTYPLENSAKIGTFSAVLGMCFKKYSASIFAEFSY